jgi:hypothetical protein
MVMSIALNMLAAIAACTVFAATPSRKAPGTFAVRRRWSRSRTNLRQS